MLCSRWATWDRVLIRMIVDVEVPNLESIREERKLIKRHIQFKDYLFSSSKLEHVEESHNTQSEKGYKLISNSR